MNQYGQKSRGAQIAVITILTVGGFFMILPFIWMVLSSLKTDAEILKIPPTIWPETFTLDNFTKLFTEMDFAIYLKNTLIIVFFSFFGLFLNAMAGYGFAKFKFKGKNKLFYLVLATMMIPGQVTMIPVYLLLNAAGLTNTMTGIVLPGLVGAFGIFLFRQFMSTISDDLLEAARLDGASEFYIFWRIVIPISRPVLAVQGILTFIAGWNSFLWPLIIANDEKFYTLSVGLQLLKGQYGSNYALQMAGATFMVIPIILIFMTFQKYILKGFNVSGMK
ncbi:carbohydrate ABC transporter permease [Listeria monocytogenes]|uniref:carbohydrate ABC transporter permease n=1 Tax=Listeria monocytogenes TaxID=1639 RepID=UPI000E754C6B|nr:carbohydrate ABC transporter permease [Listeria monocytogenes]EAE8989311.1 carbohydrate ABC transporter permease [Listeria monocytogenes]EAE8989488.1 carbohydrate ABC transporter permease [Listeria monocytogenes]EMA2103450.1 carbohydrate ABC transporter permease [Listeria monocytogenes]EMA2103677.1 carbohydrate ABC transporter permease [Listeria monocytogenes]PRZ99647.1 sugar ABC transporter permease [Listeria monocytogenes]